MRSCAAVGVGLNLHNRTYCVLTSSASSSCAFGTATTAAAAAKNTWASLQMSGKSWVLATAPDLVETHPVGSGFPPVQPSVPASGVLFISHSDTVALTRSRPPLGRYHPYTRLTSLSNKDMNRSLKVN